jgi:hypothetical protein
MKIKSGTRKDFRGYSKPLRLLEQTFQAVGSKVDFTLCLGEDHFGFKNEIAKWVEIKHGDRDKLVILNGATPEEVISMVACYLNKDLCPWKMEKRRKYSGKEKQNG